jgi:putative FmdB family regulatory protein
MPTYDYRCDDCGHAFEEFQPMTARPLRKCPECGRMKLKRLIGTGAGIIFKGSGFYETDYRSDSYKKAAESETKSTKPESDSKSKSKSEPTTTKAKGSDAKSSESKSGSEKAA